MAKIRTSIYAYEKQLDTEIERIKKSKELSVSNKKVILDFRRACSAEGLSDGRTLKYMQQLQRIAKWLDSDLKKAKRKNIEKLLAKLNRTNLAPRTKNDYGVALKKFYRWLRKTDEYPKEVKWIKTGAKLNNHTLPEELLTEEEIKKMIGAASHLRNKALISTLYESGCRIGELGSMKIKHVVFDKYGTRIMVNGKTGMRRIRLVSSTPHLAAWKNSHPMKDDQEAYLWVIIGVKKGKRKERHELLDYDAMVRLIQRIGKKAGIKKKVNPHRFRHSRATELAKHLTEAQMKEYFGWVQSSKMAGVYVHLSGRDTDKTILELSGLVEAEEKKEERALKPIRCPICEFINENGSKFCSKCGKPLSLKIAMELDERRTETDEWMSELIKDAEVRNFLGEKLEKLKNKAL